MKVSGFENSGEERVIVVSNVIGSMDKETYVNSVKVPDAKACCPCFDKCRPKICRRLGRWGCPPEDPPTRIF